MSVCKLNQLQIHTECRKGKCGIRWMPKKYCPLFICAISKCHAFTYIFCPKIDLVAVDKVLKWNLFSVKSFESPTIFWLWRCSKCIWINFVNKFCWKLNGGPENFLRNFLHNSNNINLPGGEAFGVCPNYINQVSNHDNTLIAQNIFVVLYGCNFFTSYFGMLFFKNPFNMCSQWKPWHSCQWEGWPSVEVVSQSGWIWS